MFSYALETGYTVTLVRGVAPREVLQVMEAEPQGTCTGADALIERQDGTDHLRGAGFALVERRPIATASMPLRRDRL
ncbi:DUF6461 domain-containing protein [Streptomyces sp. NPDC046197]|uniref:DUF6461 domain-containing protein n=1 Tax=Streptomyces sp. NPDC046197 TaxID=3154337 RepID=UPI0033DA16C4